MLLICGANPMQNTDGNKFRDKIIAKMGGLKGVANLHTEWLCSLPRRKIKACKK